MRFVACMTLGLCLILFGCGARNEVSRVTSPDGRIDAIVIETDCGHIVTSVTKFVWGQETPPMARK
jgi:hypothetical protein